MKHAKPDGYFWWDDDGDDHDDGPWTREDVVREWDHWTRDTDEPLERFLMRCVIAALTVNVVIYGLLFELQPTATKLLGCGVVLTAIAAWFGVVALHRRRELRDFARELREYREHEGS